MSNFDNIGGIYAKDNALRQSVNDLRSAVTSKTIKPLTVNNDGTYTANPADGVYGYSPVTVSVNPPWHPLNDGYSNFWFELTDDTLSPWLNFSAKNANATIDWGDGSGEQSLDTLTPTHTYSKAGRYIVKCKGVNGIDIQIKPPIESGYISVLKAVELNNEINSTLGYSFTSCIGLKNVYISSTSLVNYEFNFCVSLENITLPSTLTSIPLSAFYNCRSLKNIIIPSTVTSINDSAFYFCLSLNEITLPSTITSIGSTAFANCQSISEVHCLPTTPPTLGTSAFANLPSDYIIYVPVGTGDTYKAAAGWSTYADHIVEEGQSLSKSQLRAIEEEQKKSDNGEEMR